MKHLIDPKIDCVFKSLLGSEENSNLLVHFLNAVLDKELKAPVAEVEILNPYNEREFLDDKLSIVDVKARDTEGRLFQVEIQMVQYGHLASRIIYNWADIYSQQLQNGDDYDRLRPTYAIWLLDDTLIAEDEDYLHDYKLRDARGQSLLDHGGIWLVELEKFHKRQVRNEEERWLLFFKEGGQLSDRNLPEWMSTPEMTQAMKTLMQFSDKERNYHAYQARQNFIREQRTIQTELETALEREAKALEEKLAALIRERAAMNREQEALAEVARLKALLEQQGKLH